VSFLFIHPPLYKMASKFNTNYENLSRRDKRGYDPLTST
jgi:hypothetical protein